MNDSAPRHGIRELAALNGTTVRTMRRWIQAGAISATDFRGPATSYGPRHVDEARAVKRLLGENLSLEVIRARLTRLSDADLARFVRPEPHVSVDGGAASTPVAASSESAAGATATGSLDRGSTDLATTGAVERWEHVTLLPGLQLLVRSDGGALVRRIAEEIRERYGLASR